MALFPGQMLREQLQLVAHETFQSTPEEEADDFGRDAFRVTDLSEYKAGIQDSANGGAENPDDPRSGAARRRQAAEAAQDIYDSYASFAYHQEWLNSSHDFGGVSMTGAEISGLADRLRKDPKYLAAIKDGLAQRGFKTPEQQAAAINDFMFYENWSKRTPEERAKFGVTDEALDRAKNSAGTKAVVQTHKDLKGIAPELGTRVDAGFEKDSDKAVTLEAAAYKVFAEVDKDRKPINQWSERSADVAISDPMVEAAKPAAVEAARLGDVEAAAVRPAAFKPDF